MTVWRVLKAGPGEDGGAWARVLADPAWEKAAECLKHDGAVDVRRASLLGREVVVKRWVLDRRGVVKSHLGLSRGFRHWRGAAWLSRHGFRTATCHALLRGVYAEGAMECLVMEALPGRSVLQHLANGGLGVRAEHAVARELGRLVVRLTRLGRFNRDGKPSNLIVTRYDPTGAEVGVVDTVGIRRNVWFDSEEPIPSLARLLIEPIGVGACPRRALMMALLRGAAQEHFGGRLSASRAEYRTLRRASWEEVREAVALHGDPRPRVDPLGPRVQEKSSHTPSGR
jgi:hypothetical protein